MSENPPPDQWSVVIIGVAVIFAAIFLFWILANFLVDIAEVLFG